MTENTVIIGGVAPQSKPAVRFPCMRFDPKTGASKVCNAPSDIPPGWIKRHPNDPKHIAEQAAIAVQTKAAAPVLVPPAPKAPAKKQKPDDKRRGVIAELTRREVKFDANETTDVLYAQLLEEVEKEV